MRIAIIFLLALFLINWTCQVVQPTVGVLDIPFYHRICLLPLLECSCQRDLYQGWRNFSISSASQHRTKQNL